jgi:hypothetical protein
MNDTAGEQNIAVAYQQVLESLKPGSSRLAWTLAGVAFFICLAIQFAALNSESREPTGNAAYALGEAMGGVMITSLVVGGILTLILSWSTARRRGQRHFGEDFLLVFGGSFAGGLAALLMNFVAVAPIVIARAEAKEAKAIHQANLEADNKAFAKALADLPDSGVVLGRAGLAKDPGYRRSEKALAEAKAIVLTYRDRFYSRQAEGRQRLAKTVRDHRQRDLELAAYDASVARSAVLTARYWALQVEIADDGFAILQILKSPGHWSDKGYLFKRSSDLERFRAAFRTYDAKVMDVMRVSDQINAQAARDRLAAEEPPIQRP